MMMFIITVLIIIDGALALLLRLVGQFSCQNLRNTIKRNVDPNCNKCGHLRQELTLAHAAYGIL